MISEIYLKAEPCNVCPYNIELDICLGGIGCETIFFYLRITGRASDEIL